MKPCIILRGLAGSGKSRIAEALARVIPGAVVVSKDRYSYRAGVYDYAGTRVAREHGCGRDFARVVAKNGLPVILDATNFGLRQWLPYAWLAECHGYAVALVTVLCPIGLAAQSTTHPISAAEMVDVQLPALVRGDDELRCGAAPGWLRVVEVNRADLGTPEALEAAARRVAGGEG